MNPMTWLWATALGLLLLALAGLLWPLLREPAPAGATDGHTGGAADGSTTATTGARRDGHVAADDGTGEARALLRQLYRAQQAELDHELGQQTLSSADRQQAHDELQRGLLDDIDRADAASRHLGHDSAWLRRVPALVLALGLPLAALGLYGQVGDPRAAATLAQAEPMLHAGPADVDAMVARLAERLEQQPDDLEGWVVLARSREVQERFDAASQAYQRAITLAAQQQVPAGFQARLHADLADALASSRDHALDGPVQAALDVALQLDADQPKALALAGTAALQRGDLAAARTHWQQLLGLLEPDTDIALRVQNDLARLDGAADTAASDVATRPTATGSAVALAPLSAAPTASSATPAGIAPRGLVGIVTLAPALQAGVQPGDTLFIVARERNGGPAPIAVLKLRAGALPADFVLDDRHAMTQDRLPSAADQLTLQARISRSGSAQRQTGEPISRPLPVRAGERGIVLAIDTLE